MADVTQPDEGRRWWAWVGASLVLVTTLPVLVAALVAPHGFLFGGFVVEARDGVSYVAKATEGLAGHWLYHDPYTSEPHPGSLIYLPYIALGQLDRALRIPLPLLLQVARIAAGVALLDAVHRLVVSHLEGEGLRRLAFILVFLGGGVGAVSGSHLQVLGYHLVALDAGVSGIQGLETLAAAPHILLACLGSAWIAILWGVGDRRPRHLVMVLTWSVVISLVYPQLAAMWVAVAATTALIRRGQGDATFVGAVALGAIPYMVYGLYLRSHNPIFSAWPPQGDIDLGDPLSYLLFAHLLLTAFAALAVMRVVRTTWRSSPLLLMVVWICVTIVMMYVPGEPAVLRRVFYGSFIPFGVLAAVGLWAAAGAITDRRNRTRLLVYGTALACVSGVRSAGEGFAIPLLHRDDAALYFPADEARALEQVARLRPAGGGVVLNSFLSGLYVPVYSRQRTYVGFPFETLDVTAKQGMARAFYAPIEMDGPSLTRMARELGVDFVLWGRYERGFGGQDVPGRWDGWEVVGRSGDAVVYRVPH